METDRRDFLIQGAGALAGMALIPGLEAMAMRAPKGYRVAIVGMGRQGRAIAAELQKLGATIAAVCDRDEPRLRSAKRRVGEAATYSDFEQLLASESSIEAISFFGMTSTWVGAWGDTSRNARQRSSS